MRGLDAPKALAIGCGIVLAVNAVILAQAHRSRSGAPTATLELTERELAMPVTREKDDTGLELTVVTSDRVPPSVEIAAVWRRIELRKSELAWLDAEKLRTLGFDPEGLVGRATGDDGDPSHGVLPRIAFVVLENDGPAWASWLSGRRPGGAEAESLAAIDRTARSRLMPVDAGLDPGRLREAYPDGSRFAIVPAAIDVVAAKGPDGSWNLRGTIAALRASSVHVPIDLLPQLTPFIPRIDREESLKSLRDTTVTGLPVPPGPRYRATVAFGRDGRPWLVGVKPIGSRGPDS